MQQESGAGTIWQVDEHKHPPKALFVNYTIVERSFETDPLTRIYAIIFVPLRRSFRTFKICNNAIETRRVVPGYSRERL